MLTENQVKEELSISYTIAVSAINNFGCELTRKDFDSIDVTITFNGKLEEDSIIRSPEIKIQLKATENLILKEDNNFHFPLTLKNYNDLRANTLAPRILVVLKLPDNRENWITHSIENLIIRSCAYWLSLKDFPDTENETNVTVFIPINNTFSPGVLRELMIKVSKQENL